MEKQKLVDICTEVRDAWRTRIETLGPDGLLQPASTDGWRVRDVIAHFNGWDRWQVVQLRCMFSGESPTDDELTGGIAYPENDDMQVDAMNAMFLGGTRDLPTDEIIRHWEEVNALRLALIDSLSQQELEATMGSDWASGSPRIFRLASEVPGVSNPEAVWMRLLDQLEHQRAHLHDLP